MNLNEKAVLISGASSGIGRAVALNLARRHCKIGLIARSADKLQELAQQITSLGGQPLVLATDVADGEAARQAVQQAYETFGRLDLVIANAGVGYLRPAHKLKPHQIDQMINVNLRGAIHILQTGLELQLQQGGGQLVGISSLASYRGLPSSSVYSATKAGLSTYLESLRVEYGRKNILVSTICPGYIRTPMTDDNKSPMPFLMEVEDAAELIVTAIEKEKKVYGFPWQVHTPVKLIKYLPRLVYESVAKFAG